MDRASVESSVNSILVSELEALKKRIAYNIRSNGSNASGETINSLRVEVKEFNGAFYGRKAFGGLETGRKPGRVPKGFYHIIKDWALNKSIQVENINSFSYLVAKKIAEQGSKLYRDGGRDTIYSQEIPQTITLIQSRVLDVITQSIDIPKIIIINNENT